MDIVLPLLTLRDRRAARRRGGAGLVAASRRPRRAARAVRARRRPGRPARRARPAPRAADGRRAAARLVAGAAAPAGRRGAAQHRPAAARDRRPVDRAAQAARPRAVGRAAPAPRGRAGRDGRALRLRRAGAPGRARTDTTDPTWWCGSPAAGRWSSTPRCRSTPSSTRWPPTTPRRWPAHLRRHVRQVRTPRRHPVRQGLLAIAADGAGVRGDVRAGRVVPGGGPGHRPLAADVRRHARTS